MHKTASYLICCMLLPLMTWSQPLLKDRQNIPPALEHQILLRKATYQPEARHKTTKTTASGYFDTSKWRHLVDSTWGVGIPDTSKLSMFNHIWNTIDSSYPCFVHLPLYNWDSLVDEMRAEIIAGVSKGRFAAILGQLRRYINDAHTSFIDADVMYPSSIYRGLPLVRGESGRFGACITMLPDSSAMVYEAVSGHPFGLEPGDIILGYNGVAWKDIVNLFLEYQLPSSVYVGSTDAASYHRLIKAAGENWYLFDTINIKKCNGNIVSFPTDYMASATNYSNLCTEQMTVPGVPKLTVNQYYNQNKIVSYGVMDNTNIGYVYMLDCTDQTGNQLYNAVHDLVQDSMVDGIIIDIRTNYGGGFVAYWKTFEYIMDGNVSWVGYGERTTPTNRYLMFNQPSSWYDITDADANSINKPIALLVGPEAVSAGDFFQLMFKHYPFLRTFGKSTAGAYGSTTQITTGQSNYYASMQPVNFYEVSNPTYYLSHTEYPVDQPVWFDRDSVCAGRDNIVGEAVDWIYKKLDVQENMLQSVEVNIFPNPAKDILNLTVVSRNAEQVTINITDIYGVNILRREQLLDAGTNNIRIDISKFDIPPGNYLLHLSGANGNVHRKFVYVR